jgi:hypothetical protein
VGLFRLESETPVDFPRSPGVFRIDPASGVAPRSSTWRYFWITRVEARDKLVLVDGPADPEGSAAQNGRRRVVRGWPIA